MKYKNFLIIIVLLWLFIISIPFSTNINAQILNTKQISVSEGLSSSNVKSIKQDDYGFMWIGTGDGLNRYDGYEFKIFKNIPGDSTSIVGNDITDLAIDKLGNVWVTTTLGASFYDRSKNIFTQYDFSGMIRNYTTSIPQCLEVFIDDSGNVFVGSVGPGLLFYNRDSDSFNRIPYSDSNAVGNQVFDLVSGIAEHKGDLYTLSWAEGLAKLNRSTGQLEKLEYIPDNPKVVIDNNLDRGVKLHADANGQVWVVTQHGIYKYNPLDKKLKTIKRYEVDNIPDLNNLSNGITVDNEGNIWIAKDTRGIFKFDGISNDYEEIKFWESSDVTGQTNLYVNDLHFDNTGILWIATNIVGINIYDPSREPFTHHSFDPANPKSISGNEIFSLYESKFNSGKIFVGTRGAGLNIFDPIIKTFTREKISLKNDMFGGSVRAILENDDGSLYLGSWGAGLLKYKNGNYKVVAEFDREKENSLSENRVRVLERDTDGKIWIGTNGGLNIFDPNNNNIERIYDKKIKVYKNKLTEFIRSNTEKSFKSILKVGDSENRQLSFKIERPRDYLVINLGEEGISTELDYDLADYGWITDNANKTVWTANNKRSYYAGGDNKNRVLVDIIKLTPGSYNLHYKSDDSHSYGKWNAAPPIDTLLWGIQLIELDDNEADLARNLIQQTENQLLIEATNIRSLHISGDIVWIGSDQQGLNKYNKLTKELKVYNQDPKVPNSISNNSVQYIYEDNNGILWLATNAGLNRFDPSTEIFTVYDQSNGLASNYIASILEDDSGSLWISTRNGLSRMTIDKKNDRASFVNYDTEDGLGGSDYIALVALKSSIGNLYFGGVHGLNEFSPKKMNNQPPNIVLTDIKISNKSITQMGEDNPISGLIMEAKEMDLNYSQNDLSFDFAALHFSRSDKNQYAHFLEGFENEWQYDNKRFAIYTNLDPGEYIFRVKGSNADGIWDYDGASIKININPPWWFTTWAYIGYGLIFILGVFGIDRIQRKRLLAKVKERRRIEEAELRAETAELQARASEAERKVLEAEFSQKKKELDEARELQLSMLPRELPQLPNLDIAVYMKTATEVGGDYYDFHIGLDGALTVVLGDATGHGMKAGTMVTTTKSLFNVLAPNPNIVETFHEMTRCLKLMQMEKLSMCMTMLKITGKQLQMSAAGMPPVFIYKRENQSIEEHVMKGMPLGTFNNFPYTLIKSELSAGDTILLMSDGFPELFNDKKEMYGYKRARNLFEELATEAPEEIISKLKTAGSEWVNDNDPDDDVTFVVIKVK